MNFFTRQMQAHKAAFLAVVVVATVALGSSLTLPFTFTAGTTARASDVNANFQAVKAAVDDNATRLSTLETLPALVAPTLLGGWSDVAGAFARTGYFKDGMGIVHLRGMVRRTSGTQTVVFNLPAGYRPSAALQFPTRCGNDTICYFHVNANGDVDFGGPAAGASSSVTFSGITFDPR
jgi:hypothetical protein